MDQQDIDKIKKSLLEEKKAIETELGQIATKNPDIKGDWVAKFTKNDSTDTLDERARNVTDYEEERAVEQSLETRLQEINLALKRIENDQYALCTNCQSSIEEKRLMAMPIIHLCIDCAQKRSNQV